MTESMPIRRSLLLVVAAGLLSVVAPALAQDLNRPPGGTRGVFGGRPSAGATTVVHQWESTTEVGGGYDTNFFLDIGDSARESQGGTAITGSTAMRYRWGNSRRFLQTNGRAYVNRQSLAARRQFVGGDANVSAATSFGRRAGATLTVGGNYDPAVLLDGFATPSVSPDAPAPPTSGVAGAPVGLANQRWFGAFGTAGAHYELTTRQRLDAQFGARRVRPTAGPGLDSDSRLGLFSHSWAFARSTAVRATYRYDTNEQRGIGAESFSIRSHTLEGSTTFERRLSPTRSARLELRGGASNIDTSAAALPDTRPVTMPVGAATLWLNIARSWQLLTSVQRSASVLAGVAPQPFVSNDAAASFSGMLGRRLSLGLGGTYSRGGALRSDSSRFTAATAFANARLRLHSCCAAFASYNYYEHQLIDVRSTPGFPTSFNNHATRVGFTLWLPLYGVF